MLVAAVGEVAIVCEGAIWLTIQRLPSGLAAGIDGS